MTDDRFDDADRVDEQLRRGLLYTQSHLSHTYGHLWDVASTAYAVADLLVQRGLLTVEDLRRQIGVVQEGLLSTALGSGIEVIVNQDARDKYADHPDAVSVDCAARLDRCRGACCALDLALTIQDVSEDVARWDAGRPYLLRRAASGRCCHQVEDGGCGIFERRPLSCRTFTCATDERIWEDFEAGVPNEAGIDALFASARERRLPRLAGPTPGEGGEPR